jgi:hypothetical protein
MTACTAELPYSVVRVGESFRLGPQPHPYSLRARLDPFRPPSKRSSHLPFQPHGKPTILSIKVVSF